MSGDAAESAGGGKGRPTPTRREAEAAAKARAKAALDPKSKSKGGKGRGAGKGVPREARMASAREVREGIKRGDPRYLGKRDRGPVRAFIRDYVDTRINMAEFALPLMFASLMTSAAGYAGIGAGILNTTLLLAVLDDAWLSFRLRRELKRRFPNENTRGTTTYALMRSLQLRFLRLPKPRVKLGQALPERY